MPSFVVSEFTFSTKAFVLLHFTLNLPSLLQLKHRSLDFSFFCCPLGLSLNLYFKREDPLILSGATYVFCFSHKLSVDLVIAMWMLQPDFIDDIMLLELWTVGVSLMAVFESSTAYRVSFPDRVLLQDCRGTQFCLSLCGKMSVFDVQNLFCSHVASLALH